MAWMSPESRSGLSQRLDDEAKHVSHLIRNKMFPGPYAVEYAYWKNVVRNGAVLSVVSLLTAWGPTKSAAPLVRFTARILFPQVVTFSYLAMELGYLARYFPDSRRSLVAEVFCPTVTDPFWKEKCAIYNKRKDQIDVRAVVAAAESNKTHPTVVVKESVRVTKNGETTSTTTTTIRKGEMKVVRVPSDSDAPTQTKQQPQLQPKRPMTPTVPDRTAAQQRTAQRQQQAARRAHEIEQADTRLTAKQVEDDDSRLKAINAHIEENRRQGKYDAA